MTSTRQEVEIGYDISNEFFRLWLDERMNYTCGIFDDSDAPYAPFRDALLADADIQCVVYQVSAGGPARRIFTPGTTQLAVTGLIVLLATPYGRR